MKSGTTVLGLCALLSGMYAAGQTPAPPPATAPAAAPSNGAEKALEAYLLKYLPFDPETRLTVSRTNEKSVPGYRAYKAHRTGRYAKLNGDRVVFVSEDGKWFFGGDTLPNRDPRPVRSSDDLGWLTTYLTNLFHTPAIAALAPERDKAGLKGVLVSCQTGYGRVRLPGYVSPDGRVFLVGYLLF